MSGAPLKASEFPSSTKTPPSTWVAFSLLCLLASSTWLLPSPSFKAASGAGLQAPALGGLGLLACLIGGRPRLAWTLLWRVSGLGALLLAVPIMLSDQVRGVNDLTRVAIFAAVPIGVVLATGLQEGVFSGQQLLLPAVAGFGGLLFILPVEVPQGLHALLSFGSVLLAACSVSVSSVILPGYLRHISFRSAVALVCLPSSLLLFLYAGWEGLYPPEPAAVFSGAVSLLQLGLLLWLLRRMQPQRLAVRFLLVPLLTAAEGYVLLHGALTGRIVFGTLVTAASALYLLLASPAEETSPLSLR